MNPIQDFLDHGNLPTDLSQARKIRRITPRYSTFNRALYKRSYQGPWLKCITLDEGIHVLRDLHEGICGAHGGSRTLVRKVILLGYFRPTLLRDSQALVCDCPSCQFNAPEHHQPTREMVPISFPWPFEQWGTNLLGPFPRSNRRISFCYSSDRLFYQVGRSRSRTTYCYH